MKAISYDIHNLNGQPLCPYKQLVPIVLFASLVPLICYLKVGLDFGSLFPYAEWQGLYVDLFSYYKAIAICICAVLASITGLVQVYRKKTNPDYKPATTLFLALSLLIILSTFISDNKHLALYGGPDRFEGMFTWISYIIMAYWAIKLVRNHKQAHFIMICMLITASIMAVIGVFQWLGYDIFSFRSVQLMLSPKSTWDYLSFGTINYKAVHGTLYNTNEASIFFAMLAPVAIVMYIKSVRASNSTLWLLLSAVLFLCLLTTNARMSLLAFTAVILILIVFLTITSRRQVISIFKTRLLPLFSLLLLIFIAVDMSSGGTLIQRIATIASFGDNIKLEQTAFIPSNQNGILSGTIRDVPVIVNEQQFTVGSGTQQVSFKANTAEMGLYNEDQQPLELKQVMNSSLFTIDNPSYSGIKLFTKGNAIVIDYRGTPITFNLVGPYIILAEDLSPALQSITVVTNRLQLTNINGDSIMVSFFPATSIDYPDGSPVPVYKYSKKEMYHIEDPHFNDIYIYRDQDVIGFVKGSRNMVLDTIGGDIKIAGGDNRPVPIKEYSTSFLSGKEWWFSSRGYIWSRCLGSLPNYILLGGGPDTFMMNFPQDDYIGKMLYLNMSPAALVEKPHNNYLLIIFNSGVISLLVYLMLVGIFLLRAIKMIRANGLEGDKEWYLLACLLGVIAFLLCSMAYDSSVSTAPIFWTLLGLGFAITTFKEVDPASSDRTIIESDSNAISDGVESEDGQQHDPSIG